MSDFIGKSEARATAESIDAGLKSGKAVVETMMQKLLAERDAAVADRDEVAAENEECHRLLDAALGEGRPDTTSAETLFERLPRLIARADAAVARVAELEAENDLWRAGTPPLPWRGLYATGPQTKYMVNGKEAAEAERDAAVAQKQELVIEWDEACKARDAALARATAAEDAVQKHLDIMANTTWVSKADLDAAIAEAAALREVCRTSIFKLERQVLAVEQITHLPYVGYVLADINAAFAVPGPGKALAEEVEKLYIKVAQLRAVEAERDEAVARAEKAEGGIISTAAECFKARNERTEMHRRAQQAEGALVAVTAEVAALREVLEEFVRGGMSVGAPEWQVRLFERAHAALAFGKSA